MTKDPYMGLAIGALVRHPVAAADGATEAMPCRPG